MKRLICWIFGHWWMFDDGGVPHKDTLECDRCQKQIPATIDGKYRTDVVIRGDLDFYKNHG